MSKDACRTRADWSEVTDSGRMAPCVWTLRALSPATTGSPASPPVSPPGMAHHPHLYQGDTTLVAVKIRLKRMGKIRTPFYRIVVADSRTKRDGRVIEEIGTYNPKADPSIIKVDGERAQYWLGVGAQPTEAVAALLTITGDTGGKNT